MTESTITIEAAPAGSGAAGQTFLVGEKIYLRSFRPGDERTATSWRSSIFPKSPELVEKWIKEDLPREGKKQRGHLAIVRKTDDMVVGSITTYFGQIGQRLEPHVDPLYGEIGQQWLAEAIILVTQWQIEESSSPVIELVLTSNNQVTIDIIAANNFVETARFREMHEQGGQRFDSISFSRFNDAWIERLGDPMAMELPRSGNGKVLPIIPSEKPEGDPPKQAVMIGKRVYLRPEDKADAQRYVDADRIEEETFFDLGRYLRTTVRWAEFIGSGAGEDFPRNLWFTVCLRENDERIGSVGLIDIDYVNRTAETGSHFNRSQYRGQGYGSEAKQLLLEYTFDVLGFHMVNSYVYFFNTRSAAALRKQGYRESGRVCWRYPYEGGFGNKAMFDLLADEWRALPRESE